MSDVAAAAAAPEEDSASRTGFGLRLVLGSAVAVSGSLLLLLVALAVLVDRQGDLLAMKSEVHGFDPSVFPPFDGAIWLLSNVAAVLNGAAFIALLALSVGLRHRRTSATS